MDLEIKTRQAQLDPELSQMVRAAMSRLMRRHPALVRMHVTFDHSTHHHLGDDEVTIVANLPGTTLRAEKREPGMRQALRAALDAIERELDREHQMHALDRRQRSGAL